MRRIMLLLLLSLFLYTRSQEVPFSERLVEEKKCQMLCKMMQLEHQCGHCNTRMPIRFGKRSQEIEVNLHTFLNAQQISENEYLMQMIMKRFFPSESNMFNLHLKY